MAAVLAHFPGALPAPPSPEGWTPCPRCGRLTPPSIYGRPASCLPCTEAECGEYADELAARVSRRMTRNAYYKLPRDSDGKPILPAITYRRWKQLHG